MNLFVARNSFLEIAVLVADGTKHALGLLGEHLLVIDCHVFVLSIHIVALFSSDHHFAAGPCNRGAVWLQKGIHVLKDLLLILELLLVLGLNVG
jgi:hypothetical protein